MNCLVCNKKLNQGKKYCSYKCYGIAQRRQINKKCPICGKIFKFPQSQLRQNRRTCSRKCHFIYQSIRPYIKGKKHHCWKGGRILTPSGYILIKRYNHPYKYKNYYVPEHRLVMEKYLGRYLTKNEIVHHINGIRSDNRLENLKLMTRGEHLKLHIFKESTEEMKNRRDD